MPWSTPTLFQIRSLVRDAIHGLLPGSDATIPNSVLRVMSDSQGALCFLTLEYIDWLALQLLPDTAETPWLDRHGQIWLTNADGTTGRKQATLASGTIIVIGSQGVLLPSGSLLGAAGSLTGQNLSYQTTEQAVIGPGPTNVPAQSLTSGTAGNLAPGAGIVLAAPPIGIDAAATVLTMAGGVDTETDAELRARILQRIRQPPMGGDAEDYVAWAEAIPGVTRAWSFPQEMGIGTMTVRFMMDDLRASNGGFPLPEDVDVVQAYLDIKRPVTVQDFFVVAPIPYPVNVPLTYLDSNDASTRAAMTQSLQNEFFVRSKPGQTFYRAWLDEAIMAAPGVNAYDLTAADAVMPSNGYMPILGNITYS
jgi:uncharacterized phage protein gp47/JayE